MKKDERKFIDLELDRDIKEFIEGDPIPQLGRFEIETLKKRILSNVPEKKTLRWFDIRPAFQIALAGAAVFILAIGLTISRPSLNPDGSVIVAAEFLLESDNYAEEMLMNAIESGVIAEDEALAELIEIDTDDANEISTIIENTDIYDDIDDLTEEEAERILELMDELGYPDIQEA